MVNDLSSILALALWNSNNEALDFRYLSIIGKATWNFFLQVKLVKEWTDILLSKSFRG